jgi:DUF971 family protein
MLHDLARSAAAGGPPFDASAVPETLTLAADRRRLRLTFANGDEAVVGAEQLRAACRCAWCTRARIDGNFSAAFGDIAIERLDPVGDYAVNIVFSDGHTRGIYPWPFLRAIADTPTPAQDGQPA